MRIKRFADRKTFKAYYKIVYGAIREYQVYSLVIDIGDHGGRYFIYGNIFCLI